MKRLLIASVLLLAPAFVSASGGAGLHLEKADIDLADQESLQRGAKYFVGYCMGCHSLKYMRYNRMAEDLGLDEVQIRRDFIFDKETKPGDLMVSAMRPRDGEKWFGTQVPDLTLVTRWRDPDWVFTYLKGFYADESRPYGVNNAVFPDVGMPHVLAGHQGLQKAVYTETEGEHPGSLKGLELMRPDNMSEEEHNQRVKEYDQMVRDLTNFLTYAGEPIKLERRRLGFYVLGFLVILFGLAYLLKKEYWKDVH
ncbi:cytochrome c1 [Candidatus Thiosymbion oneisti]|uniref:cytochrome c1 n=1 Tax=Candidatus Thiosymbion oneisti TaxID=589554 RepID=UPI000B0820C6|nr:cytochrome c1 [Candidatus Thiosymbion oneisti]